ncbi:MAG: hypothetical protein KIT14_21650 [bacterium]|nr:hypothetical protein [bacterium]
MKDIINDAQAYGCCTAGHTDCLTVFWVTEFGYDDDNAAGSKQQCHVCSWGYPGQGAGSAAVDVLNHCLNRTKCGRIFYWDLINRTARPDSTCACDPALLNPDGSERDRFEDVGDFIGHYP